MTNIKHLTMKKLLLAVMMLTFLGVSLSRAQEENEKISFTLQEAIDYAMANAYQKISADYDVESAKKKLWESIAIGLPQVDGTAAYNHSLDLPVSLMPVEIIPPEFQPPGAQPGDKVPVSFATAFDANFRIAVNQLLFDGSYIVGLQASKVFLKLNQEQREKAEIEIRNTVFQAYYLAMTAQENVLTFKKSLEVNKKTLKETKAYYENGFREEIDVSQIELMVSNGESRLLEVTRSYDVAMAVLKFSIGMNLEQELNLTDNMVSMLLDVAIYDTNPSDFKLDNHIDYKLAETNVESMNLFFKNEKAQYLPKLSASYSYSKSGFGDDWNIFGQEWYPSQFIGLNLSVPIFTSGYRSAKVKQEKINYLKAQNDQLMTSENLKKDYLNASTNLATAREQYMNSLKNKELANKIYNVTLTKFNNGLVGSTVLSQNETQYIDSEVAYIDAVLNMLKAHIEYQKITGKL